jgi:4-amino-4-deoxy-L-arabinose transferase-like glycosyltransferase
MRLARRGVLGAFIGGGILLLALGQSVRVPYASTEQRVYTRTVGEIHGEREVGQTFESVRPVLTGVAFQFATFGGRENTEDVLFELREHVRDAEPLRRAVVNARALGDHQLYRFTFEPVRGARGKTYYASIHSPTSRPGNAVTLDYSNGDPYAKGPERTLLILTGPRSEHASFDGAIKPQADAAFAISHDVTFWEYSRLFLMDGAQSLRTLIREEPGRIRLNAQFFAASVLLSIGALAGAGRYARYVRRPSVVPIVLGILLVLGFGLRALYIQRLPYTNDEGFYLYDAQTILEGRLPGGDALAKAPVAIGAFAVGIMAFGRDLDSARLTSALVGVLTALPLFVIARYGGGKRAGVTAALLWLLAAAPALFTSYGHTQPIQVIFATCGMAAVILGLVRKRWGWFVVAGLLLGIAVAARKSTLALGIPVALVLVLEPGTARQKLQRLALTGAGFIAAIAAFLFFVNALYGASGVRYATGLDLVRTSFEQLEDRGDLYATYSVKGVLPFFREALPLVFLGLLGLGWGSEWLLRRVGSAFARLGWLLPIFLAWRGWVFLERFEEEAHRAWGLFPFWIVMSLALVACALLPRRSDASPADRRARLLWLLSTTWFLGVAFFYALWIKFHANYLLEFLPPLVLLAALGAHGFRTMLARRAALMAVPVTMILLIWGGYASAHLGYAFPHTGTFHPSSIREAAQYLREHVPPDDLILTGAVAIPYLSGHHVPHDAAHPTWYAYGFIEPELRNVFMASAEQMVETVFRDVRWMVIENVTKFSYFREYPAIEQLRDEEFEKVTEIENPSNTIRIFRRK